MLALKRVVALGAVLSGSVPDVTADDLRAALRLVGCTSHRIRMTL